MVFENCLWLSDFSNEEWLALVLEQMNVIFRSDLIAV